MSRRALALWAAAAGSAGAFECKTDIKLGPVVASGQKGIAIDDTTLWNCSSRIPAKWPNSEEKVASVRLFKAWDDRWDKSARNSSWDNVEAFLKANNAKVLIGTQISCNETDDLVVWNWTKEFVKRLDPSHVMGLAIGNEMELLYMKTGVDSTVTGECITEMWSGEEFFNRFSKFVSEFDKMGFHKVPVTSVFGGFTLTPYEGFPFYNDPKAMVSDFFSKCWQAYKERFVFTFNLYPYFDPNLELDDDGGCKTSLSTCSCWTAGCNVPATAAVCRQKIKELTGTNGVLWLGETGWSAPAATTLDTAMGRCEEWSSNNSFKDFYSGFLKWNLSDDKTSPDHVFYFAAHDSVNFGVGEHFGLMAQCKDVECKLHSGSVKNTTKEPPAYDCDDGLDNWQDEWTDQKIKVCCLHMAGCPTTKRGSTTTSVVTSTTKLDEDTTPTSFDGPELFDCESGLWAWKGWPEEKQTWCCNHHGRACVQNDKPFDCQHWLDIWQEGWTKEKKEWCCKNEQLGCPDSDADGTIRMASEEQRMAQQGSSMERLFHEYPVVISFGAGLFGVFTLFAAVFGCSRMMGALHVYSGLDDALE